MTRSLNNAEILQCLVVTAHVKAGYRSQLQVCHHLISLISQLPTADANPTNGAIVDLSHIKALTTKTNISRSVHEHYGDLILTTATTLT